MRCCFDPDRSVVRWTPGRPPLCYSSLVKIGMDAIAWGAAAWHADCTMSRVSLLLRSALLTSFLVLAAAACKKDPPPPEAADDLTVLAEDGTDSATAETDAEVVTSSLVSAAAAGGSVALASNDGAKAIYFPRGCLAVTSDAATKTVTYGFTNCSNTYGIVRITGTVIATYEVSPNTLVLNLVGTNLHVNRSTIDWSARAEITANGPARTMSWHGQLSGTTARGKEFSRTNDKVVSWRFGERCFAVSGASEGHVRGRFLRTEIADFRRCQGSCPEAGGRITITNSEKLKVEILYDGTTRATYTTPKGSTSVELLACKGV